MNALELTLREASREVLVGELMRGALDIAVLRLPSASTPGRSSANATSSPVRPVHHFEAKNAVPLRELEGEDYLQRVDCQRAATRVSKPTTCSA